MEVKRLEDLRQDPKNANKGSQRGIYMLETSLERYGAGRSILVDKNDVIIAGNKTADAAASLGLEEIQVVESDGTKLIVVKRTDLDLSTDHAAKELAIVDNRAAEVGLAWEPTVLAELADTVDLSAFFFEDELGRILEAAGNDLLKATDPPDDFKEYDEEIETEHQCPKCGYAWSGGK